MFYACLSVIPFTGGHAWQEVCIGGICGRGVCMTCVAWGYVWQEGVHSGGGHAWQERRPLKRVVRILLEYVLLVSLFFVSCFNSIKLNVGTKIYIEPF